jgi:hypothetical protein
MTNDFISVLSLKLLSCSLPSCDGAASAILKHLLTHRPSLPDLQIAQTNSSTRGQQESLGPQVSENSQSDFLRQTQKSSPINLVETPTTAWFGSEISSPKIPLDPGAPKNFWTYVIVFSYYTHAVPVYKVSANALPITIGGVLVNR